MNRNKAIQIIEDLYPADSNYLDTAELGESLLNQAKCEVAGWRTESTEVLIRYAQLCIKREQLSVGVKRQYN